MECSDSELQPPLKNQKTESDVFHVEDRISRLPDAVICHILSLTPTKYSIRTSVLSKRWENLWALSPKISLDLVTHKPNIEDYDMIQLCSTFSHSVNNLFFLRDSLRIENFKLVIDELNAFIARMRLNSWICATVMCNVRELDLEIGDYSPYPWKDHGENLGELPWCLFTCKTLVILKLSGRFILNVPHYVCLSKQKTLILDSIIYLDDVSFRKLLSGCPLLEDLKIIIRDLDPISILNVDHSSLKRFSVFSERYDDRTYKGIQDDQYKIVVDAPNLEFIDLKTWSDDILLKSLPSIVEARVDVIAYENRDKVLTLLKSMALHFSIERALPTFCNLVHLELSYDEENGPVRLMDLLRSSPKLEALSLTGGSYFGDDSDFDSVFCDYDPEQVPECLHSSLKIVQI